MIPKRVALRSRHDLLRTSKDVIGAFRRCGWRKRRGFAPVSSGTAVLLRPFRPRGESRAQQPQTRSKAVLPKSC